MQRDPAAISRRALFAQAVTTHTPEQEPRTPRPRPAWLDEPTRPADLCDDAGPARVPVGEAVEMEPRSGMREFVRAVEAMRSRVR